MRGRKYMVACVVLLAACVLVIAASARAAAVQVAITLSTEDGRRLPGGLFCAYAEGQGDCHADGVTDANGTLVLTVEAPPGATFVEIRKGFGRPSTIPEREQPGVSKVCSKLCLEFFVEPAHRVPLVPGQANYQLNITAWNAVTVCMTFVDQHGQPAKGATLFGPRGTWPGGTRGDDVKPLKALRRGVDADLAAAVHVGPYLVVKPVHLDASQTQGDVKQEGVVVTQPPAGVEIHTRLSGDAAAREAGFDFGALQGMTVISLDGSLVATFRAGPAAGAQPGAALLELLSNPQWKPTLPPGEYVVVPGFFWNTRLQAAVLRLLDKKVDLSTTDIPRITVCAGAPNDQMVDLLKACEAIERLSKREGIPCERGPRQPPRAPRDGPQRDSGPP